MCGRGGVYVNVDGEGVLKGLIRNLHVVFSDRNSLWISEVSYIFRSPPTGFFLSSNSLLGRFGHCFSPVQALAASPHSAQNELASRPPATIDLLLLARVVKHLFGQSPSAALPIAALHLPFDLTGQVPKVAIMVPENDVRELMAERLPDDFVVAIAIVGVGAQPEFDDFAPVAVEAEGAAFVRRVLGRIHFGEHADAKFVRRHGRLNPRI